MRRTIILAAIGCFAAGAVAQVSYEVADLGAIAGPAQAAALNNNGQATGFSIGTVDSGSPFLAFRADGSFETIAPLPGDAASHGFDIEESGVIVGASFTIGMFRTRAFLDVGLGPVELGEFQPRAMNDAGVVVGAAAVTLPSGWRSVAACRWESGVLTTLGGLGGTASEAFDVSPDGWIVGSAHVAGDQRTHAALWTGATVRDLGTLGGPRSQAKAVNAARQAAGWSDTGTGRVHACRFDLGPDGSVLQIHDLGVLGGNASTALGINGSGRVVGTSDARAFLHDGTAMIDLNTRIPPESGWILGTASAINDSGQIVGWGFHNGLPRAFLLTPACAGDLSGDGHINTDDFITFLGLFAIADPRADLKDQPEGTCGEGGDGTIDTDDFICFLTLFASGCP